MRDFLRFLLIMLTLGFTSQIATAEAVDSATAACQALRDSAHSVQFWQISDAPTKILSADVVPPDAAKGTPEICRVEGNISPTIGFLLRMPTKTWNGKFMMGGCGGPCGNYLEDRIDPALARNYAVVTTDMGHKGQGWNWAYHNLDGQIDFGYRSTHLVALVAKVIIAEYYGKKATRNYYWGCSTGGRQGMVEAQRFPKDFEGIIAGAPVWNQTGNNPYFGSWNALVNIDKNGKPILDAKKLPMIHESVLAACDALDGLKDGILQDPRRCKWDPSQILCKGGNQDSCLTQAEAEVVRKINQGATNSKGERLYWGMPPGSEDQWTPIWINSDGKPGTALGGPGFIADTMQHWVAFFYEKGPFYSAMDFNYDEDPERIALKEWIFNAQNPDLRKFKNAGGKLILFTGWHDNNIPPEAAVDYYETTTRTMGGEKATKEFFRLFLLPAVNHCRGGLGGGEVDWITALENWVEKSQAPEQVIAYHLKDPYPVLRGACGGEAPYTVFGRHPLDPSTYDRTRPVYAYPDVAMWSGKGDPNQASSWQKALR